MFFLKEKEWKMHLDKGGLYTVGSGSIDLECLRGLLWITWPGSGDVILREGDELSVAFKGVLCVTAFSESFIHVKRRILLKHVPAFVCRKIFSTALSLVKSDGPVFGGSVHSITR